MRMWAEEAEYRKTLALFGYHGVFVCLLQVFPKEKRPTYFYLTTTFWSGDAQISFNITCNSGECTYEEIEDGLRQFFSFSGSSLLRDLSTEDNIKERLLGYLMDNTSFSGCQLKGKYVKYVVAYLKGIEYQGTIRVCSVEDRSLDKYDEDHDAMLEYCGNELVNLLTEKGMQDFQLELSPDFLSVNVTIPYNHKIHHINIRIFYQDVFDNWKDDVVDLVLSYYNMLSNLGTIDTHKYKGYLQELGFYEMDTHIDGLGNVKVIAYRGGDKYRVGISIENEIIPFDNMEGHDFERFCATVLAHNGFDRIKVTQGSGDQGVDIIAYKDDEKYGIQCKRHSSDIGNRAVQEVFTGKTYYQCHVGVVLTNRNFTKSAVDLANRIGIVLWNRDKLLQMVEKYNAWKDKTMQY